MLRLLQHRYRHHKRKCIRVICTFLAYAEARKTSQPARGKCGIFAVFCDVYDNACAPVRLVI